MSKWNIPTNTKDTKVNSYYQFYLNNKVGIENRIIMFNKVLAYLKETKDFEICNALRGIVHGSNISNSFTIENIFSECINSFCNDTWTAFPRVENKYNGRESNIDVVLKSKDGRRVYCEIKNGGINHTFNNKHKSADYVERFLNSNCNEFLILTIEDPLLFDHWNHFVENYVSKEIEKSKCMLLGSEEFLKEFKRFDTEHFISEVKNDGSKKLINNIESHIIALESLISEKTI